MTHGRKSTKISDCIFNIKNLGKRSFILGDEHAERDIFRGYDVVVDKEAEDYLRSFSGKTPVFRAKARVGANGLSWNKEGSVFFNDRLSGPRAITREMAGRHREVGAIIGDQFTDVNVRQKRKTPDFSRYESRLAEVSERLISTVRRRVDAATSIVELDSNDLEGVGLEVWMNSNLGLADSNNIQAPYIYDRLSWVNKFFRNMRDALEEPGTRVVFDRPDSEDVQVLVKFNRALAAK